LVIQHKSIHLNKNVSHSTKNVHWVPMLTTTACELYAFTYMALENPVTDYRQVTTLFRPATPQDNI